MLDRLFRGSQNTILDLFRKITKDQLIKIYHGTNRPFSSNLMRSRHCLLYASWWH